MYRNYIKRIIDFVAALVGLVVLSPVLLTVTLGLAIANSGKPFFFQLRPGKDEKIFRIIKFKTMTDATDRFGNLLPDSDRLTRLGALVRKTSLDEIPQLINVLKGDMSLIGPRPLLIKYLDYYTPAERVRHSVRPGITGWAQLKGRNTLNWDARLGFDIEYVHRITFLFDMRILFDTVKKVLRSEDIVIDPRSIMKDLDEERKH